MIYLSLLRVMQLEPALTNRPLLKEGFVVSTQIFAKLQNVKGASFWMLYTCWGLMSLKTMSSSKLYVLHTQRELRELLQCEEILCKAESAVFITPNSLLQPYMSRTGTLFDPCKDLKSYFFRHLRVYSYWKKCLDYCFRLFYYFFVILFLCSFPILATSFAV